MLFGESQQEYEVLHLFFGDRYRLVGIGLFQVPHAEGKLAREVDACFGVGIDKHVPGNYKLGKLDFFCRSFLSLLPGKGQNS